VSFSPAGIFSNFKWHNLLPCCFYTVHKTHGKVPIIWRYGLGAKWNVMNFSVKESPWYFTDYFRHFADFLGHFTDSFRAFYTLFSGNYRLFRRLHDFWKKNLRQQWDSNHWPHDPVPDVISTAILKHIQKCSKNW
jgi:hypothetical protein